MLYFNSKVLVGLITSFFCLSQTLPAGEIPLSVESNHPPTTKTSESVSGIESGELPNPADLLTENPLSPATELEGGSGAFVDPSQVVFHEGAFLDDSEFKFGGASVRFDGMNDFLSIADQDDFDFGTGDFTIDFWVRFASWPNTHGLFAHTAGAGEFWVDITSGANVFVSIGGIISSFTNSVASLQENTWYHFAFVRATGMLTLYVNGTAITSGVNNGNSNSTAAFEIGRNTENSRQLNGWLDEFRVSKGLARWTSNFTVPAGEHVSDPNTNLLLHFNLGPDEEAPVGSVTINNGDSVTNNLEVTLTLSAQDNVSASNAIEMAFSQDGINFTDFEPFSFTKQITLEGNDGPKTITVRFRDEAGNSQDFFDEIILDADVIAFVPIVGSIDINNGESETNNAEVNLILQVSGGTMGSDGNRNGSIDAADYTVWRDRLGWQSAGFWDTNPADYNADGKVDQNDYNFWKSKFGNVDSVIEMAFSQDGVNFTPFEPFNSNKQIMLQGPDGWKTITVRFRDEIGHVQDFSDTILLDTNTVPEGSVVINDGSIATFSDQVVLTLSTPVADLQMAFSQDEGQTFTPFEPFNTTKQLSLTGGDGFKKIIVRLQNQKNEITDIQDTIYFEFAPPTGAYFASRHHPLVIGNHWNFTNGSFPTTVDIIGTRVIGGATVFIQRYDDGSEDYSTSNSEGVKLYGGGDGAGDEIIFDRPLRQVPNFIMEGGVYSDSVTGTYMGFSFTMSAQSNVFNSQDITTSNGALFKKALHIRTTLTLNFPGLGITDVDVTDYWFVRNLGIVQFTDVDGTHKIINGINHYVPGRKHVDLFAIPQATNNPAPDSFIYFEYHNENFNGTGLGRIFKRQRTDASYELLEYHNGTNQIKRLERYNPAGNLIEVLEFEPGSGSGTVLSLLEPQILSVSQSTPSVPSSAVSSKVMRTPLIWDAFASRSTWFGFDDTNDESTDSDENKKFRVFKSFKRVSI